MASAAFMLALVAGFIWLCWDAGLSGGFVDGIAFICLRVSMGLGELTDVSDDKAVTPLCPFGAEAAIGLSIIGASSGAGLVFRGVR